MSSERLQKVLARAGVASRRHAEELILAGEVTVNGEIAGLGDKVDPATDAIKVQGRRIVPPREHHYLVLYKPAGVMTTVSDPEGRPTVMDLVPPKFRKALVPVGRLDFNTEGLLLLTDDGDFAHRVAHPRYGCFKVYEVKIKGTLTEDDLARLRRGTVIEGRRTIPKRVESLRVRGSRSESSNTWWKVELNEGRSREIREMFFRIGHPVQRLRRVAIGPLSDPRLPIGALRELTESEVEALRRATQRIKPPIEAPVETPKAAKPAAKPAARPTVKPPAKGATKPLAKAAGKPVGKPASKAGAKPASRPATRRPSRGEPRGRRP